MSLQAAIDSLIDTILADPDLTRNAAVLQVADSTGWSVPDTREVVAQLLEKIGEAGLLDEEVPWNSLKAMVQEIGADKSRRWARRYLLTLDVLRGEQIDVAERRLQVERVAEEIVALRAQVEGAEALDTSGWTPEQATVLQRGLGQTRELLRARRVQRDNLLPTAPARGGAF